MSVYSCPNINCPNTDKMNGYKFCPDCGAEIIKRDYTNYAITNRIKKERAIKRIPVNQKPEPTLRWWETASIISGLILFVIPGLILAGFYYYDLEKKKEAWRAEQEAYRQEKIIEKLDSLDTQNEIS